MIKSFEDLERLLKLMDQERITHIEVGDVKVDRAAFTPRDKPKADAREEDEDTPFGYPKGDLL